MGLVPRSGTTRSDSRGVAGSRGELARLILMEREHEAARPGSWQTTSPIERRQEIGATTRFRSSPSLAAYVGLTPGSMSMCTLRGTRCARWNARE